MTTSPRDEYRVKLRGTVETAAQVYAESAEQAGAQVTANGWNMVWGDHEGEEGEVCDQLDDVMLMEIMSVEFVRELPPPPKPPQNVYDHAIMQGLVNLLGPYVQCEAYDYAEHGGADHPYHQTYQAIANLVDMWNHKGVEVKLSAPTPEELDQQRTTERLTVTSSAD